MCQLKRVLVLVFEVNNELPKLKLRVEMAILCLHFCIHRNVKMKQGRHNWFH